MRCKVQLRFQFNFTTLLWITIFPNVPELKSYIAARLLLPVTICSIWHNTWFHLLFVFSVIIVPDSKKCLTSLSFSFYNTMTIYDFC